MDKELNAIIAGADEADCSQLEISTIAAASVGSEKLKLSISQVAKRELSIEHASSIMAADAVRAAV
jgi:hypothetical protein